MLGLRIAAIALSVGAVVAQNLPACANGCIGGDSYGTNCNKLDVACICKSSGWISGLACCVSTACSAQDQADTIAFANKICAGAGVTTLPQTATCASTAASGASTGGAVASTASSSSVPASTTAASGSVAAATTASSASRGAAAIQTAGSIGMGALLAGLAVAL